MAKYLLNCECGNSVPIEVGQAGGKVDCTCGRTLDVPALRAIRHLPRAPESSAAATATWNVRKGVVAVFSILALALAAFALLSWLTQPKLPEFNPSSQMAMVDQELERMTPTQAWQMWIAQYRPLAERGFSEMRHPHEATILGEIDRRQFLRKVVLVVVGVCAALAIVAAVWPTASARR